MAYDPLHQTPTGPILLSVALMLSPGDETGPGAEVARSDYARRLISFVMPSDEPADSVVLANLATVEWPRAISLWGDIGWLTAYTQDGVYFGWGAVVDPVDEITPRIVRIDRGDVARFRASGMRISPGYQPPRPYGVGPYGGGRYSRYAQMLAINGSVSGAFLPAGAPCSGPSMWVLEALP